MEIMKWQAESKEAALRIDKWLALHCPDFSRSYVQQLIEKQCVLVNGQAVRSSFKVKEDDTIELHVPEKRTLEAVAQPMDLDIVYEDSDVIVINKPRGMVVHPGAGNPDHTLVNGLLAHCRDLSGINGVLRPGIVHRIDKDTTGLLVACKNDRAHESLAKQLENKSASRKYMALVHGVMPHDYGTIDAPIGRDEKDRQKMAVTDKNARNAITHFKVVERFDRYTLMECSLETGRTHQIRVHLQYIGFPIVGDQRYSIKKTLKTDGQMLHAFELTFVHPTSGKRMTFHAPMPAQYTQLLHDIRAGRDDLWK